MKKIFIFILCILTLTSCSHTDSQCWYCRKAINSEDAQIVQEQLTCDDCYFNANTCDNCYKRYIDSHYDKYGYCEPCVENHRVLYCAICNQYKHHDDVVVEPYINGSYYSDNVCCECLENY